MLWMFQRVMFGPIKNPENQELKDLSGREILVLFPLIVAIFAMGLFPNFFFQKLEPSMKLFLSRSERVVRYAQTSPTTQLQTLSGKIQTLTPPSGQENE